jgi:uncharacterized membrane protein YfcA
VRGDPPRPVRSRPPGRRPQRGRRRRLLHRAARAALGRVPPVSANASTTVALWPASLSSAVAYRREILGGYSAAFLARQLPPRHVRIFILVVAWTMTAYFFLE